MLERCWLIAALAACDASGAITPAGHDAKADNGTSDGGTCDDAVVPIEPTLIAIGAGGELATLALGAPWTPRATAQLDAPIASLRVHGGKLYAVTAEALHVLAIDLSVVDTIPLPGADARDVELVCGAAIVSQRAHASLARIDLATHQITPIDLTLVAGGAGSEMLARCGSRMFVQLRRTSAPALAVIDLGATGGTIVQSIRLAHPPAFAMHADCVAGEVYTAEPVPLFEGGGNYQRVDLEAATATTLPYLDGHGEVGGFVMTGNDDGWFITHTEFGPSPSSHLARVADGEPTGLWSTFTPAHIDRLALDRATGQLFFPDGCTTNCKVDQTTGVQVFDVVTGTRLTTTAIDVGFPPVDVVVAR